MAGGLAPPPGKVQGDPDPALRKAAPSRGASCGLEPGLTPNVICPFSSRAQPRAGEPIWFYFTACYSSGCVCSSYLMFRKNSEAFEKEQIKSLIPRRVVKLRFAGETAGARGPCGDPSRGRWPALLVCPHRGLLRSPQAQLHRWNPR